MVNRDNYLLTKLYLKYLSEVTQLDAQSVQRYWFHLRHLLLWADGVAVGQAAEIRPAFPAYIATVRGPEGDQPLAPVSAKKIIQTTKRFFKWLLVTYPHEYRAFPAAWIETLRPPKIAPPADQHQFVTLDEVRQIAALSIADDNLALRRDRAAAIMLYLSGMRAGAFGTLPISAVDLQQRAIRQWPSLGVATKNSKSAITYLLDIPDLIAVVEQWDQFIRTCLPTTAMWYTPTISQWGEQTLSADRPGANRNIAVSKRMRLLFRAAGVPYKSPHKFRHGHAVYALQHAKTMADYKAVSMNLMHDDIRVTDSIYAPLTTNEVQQRIAGLTGGSTPLRISDNGMTDLVNSLSNDQLSELLIAMAPKMKG